MNSCAAVGLDSLTIFNRLKKTGISDEHARIQTEILCGQAEFCAAEIRQVIENYDAARRRESATGGDVQDVRLEVEKVRAELKIDIEGVRLEVEKVRAEIEKVRAETEKIRSELKTDIEGVRLEVEKVRAETEKVRSELKSDIEGVRLEVEKVRAEIEKVRAETEKVKHDLLKWIFGLGIGLGTIMVTGFGTLGVIMAKALNWSGF